MSRVGQVAALGAAAAAASVTVALAWPRPALPEVVVRPGEPVAAAARRAPGGEVRLAPGRHDPFTLDVAVTVRGGPEVVVGGGIDVRADGARLEDLVVAGGRSGVLVRDAEDVVLDNVTVRGTEAHGIEVVDASVRVGDCVVEEMSSGYAQGVEVRNSLGRPRTVVTGCRVDGGQEGVVAHVSRVELRDNLVFGTTMRGIAVTEMSEGLVEANTVTDATGAGLYCGDLSHCEIRDNAVSNIRHDGRGVRSRAGQAVVAWYKSTMRLSGNHLDVVSSRPVGVFEGSTVVERFPLSVWPPGWRGALPAIPVSALALGGVALARLGVGRAGRLARPGQHRPGSGSASPATRRLVLCAALGGLAVQGFHMFEHGVQVWQAHVAEAEIRSGLVGARADTEWVHLLFNVAVLAFVVGLARAGRHSGLMSGGAGSWLMAAGLAQGYHLAEHVAKVFQHITLGIDTAPGIIGGNFDLVWFHYGVNLAVMAGTVVGVAGLAGAYRRERCPVSVVSEPRLRPVPV